MLIGLPTLHTPRLRLTAFSLTDAEAVHRLAGKREVSRFTLSIPHPYTKEMAPAWISQVNKKYLDEASITWAIRLPDTNELVGCVSLELSLTHSRAELGYWIAQGHWGKGYASEAAWNAVNYAFLNLKLNKVHASAVADNVASGKVLQKIGMAKEGCLLKHRKINGRFYDVDVYGVLSEEFRPLVYDH